MKTSFVAAVTLLLLLFVAACGGNTEATQVPQEPASEAASAEAVADTTNEGSPPTRVEATEEPVSSVAGEVAVDSESELEPLEGAESDQNAADAPVGPVATAVASGLALNPDPVVPGEPFIVLGTIINVSMIPVDAPQFLIDGDNGVRYRVDAQPVAEIFVEDGSQLLPHEFRPGLRVLATVLLPADATRADVAISDDLMLLLTEE